MPRQSPNTSLLIILALSLIVVLAASPSLAQSATRTLPQGPLASGPPHVRPVSMAHLYWHFLVYQNYLDEKAAQLESQGQSGSGLRNQLQRQAGISDADYVSIRTSSGRLATEVRALDSQAATIRKAGPSAASLGRLQALSAQRESAINAEIAFLKQNLSPDKIKAFEAFLTKLFSLNNAVHRPPSPIGQLAIQGVQ